MKNFGHSNYDNIFSRVITIIMLVAGFGLVALYLIRFL
jgi:hypothetical protein